MAGKQSDQEIQEWRGDTALPPDPRLDDIVTVSLPGESIEDSLERHWRALDERSAALANMPVESTRRTEP